MLRYQDGVCAGLIDYPQYERFPPFRFWVLIRKQKRLKYHCYNSPSSRTPADASASFLLSSIAHMLRK